MATLSEKKRDNLKESQFGLPEERKYPMPDESHARQREGACRAAGEGRQPLEGRREEDRPQGRQDPRRLIAGS